MILDAIKRFTGTIVQPDKVADARAALAEAMTGRDKARAAHEKAEADLERVESILSGAADRIESCVAAARAARKVRQDARAAALMRGEADASATDTELAAQERTQLAAISDARIERRAAEQALDSLRAAAIEAKDALRIADERFVNARQQVVAAQIESTTQGRLEELAAEFSALTRWRAAACECGAKVAPPPRITFQFSREHMQPEMTAINDFLRHLESDSGAPFDA